MPTKDYSKGYIVNIFEGESEFVIDNHLLGKFTVVGIPYNVKEKTIVKINLYIDHDSILTVVAKTNDVENKKIIIKKENMYNEDDMKRFKENMIDFDKKDEMRKLVAKDLNAIVDLNNQLKKNVVGRI
jgi:molecular chaperone DnaK (HSP70)